MHSFRDAQVDCKDGSTKTIKTSDMDYWHMWGGSNSKGKMNDHVFHTASMDHIVSHYQQDFAANGQLSIKHVIVWTDNCSNQIKCAHTFLHLATFGERHPGVTVTHCFAEKYCFKGVHDGAGKVRYSSSLVYSTPPDQMKPAHLTSLLLTSPAKLYRMQSTNFVTVSMVGFDHPQHTMHAKPHVRLRRSF